MTRWHGVILFVVAALLFLIANRGAYKGYFQDDEIDNLSWAPQVPAQGYLTSLLTPRFLANNFRPAGHFFFHAAGKAFGLDFPKYVGIIQAIHLLNVLLLWLLLRQLGADTFAASAGALFFAFHMAAFDIYWKPMYVFDLLCGSFAILCLLLYVRGRWIWALVMMWLAYKSKELAVMLPVALAAYEYWLGGRRWKRLLPFVAVSLLFGLQGLFWNPNTRGDYAMVFTPGALAKTTTFYSSRVLLFPFAGFALLALLPWTNDRRVWMGLVTMLGFFVPLAFLLGRLFSAYTYVPLIGLSIAVSALAKRERAALVVMFFAFWIPWNVFQLKLLRRTALTVADENRRYVQTLGNYLRSSPGTQLFVYDGRPFSFAPWGIEGAIRWFTGDPNRQVLSVDAEGAAGKLQLPSVAILSWDPIGRTLHVVERRPGVAGASFVRMDRSTPIWQLESGWYSQEEGFRWMEAAARAWLERPAGAQRFEATFNINQALLDAVGPVRVKVSVDGSATAWRSFDTPGWHTAQWLLPPAASGRTEVEFHVEPGYQPPNETRKLGLAVVSFGFPPQEQS